MVSCTTLKESLLYSCPCWDITDKRNNLRSTIPKPKLFFSVAASQYYLLIVIITIANDHNYFPFCVQVFFQCESEALTSRGRINYFSLWIYIGLITYTDQKNVEEVLKWQWSVYMRTPTSIPTTNKKASPCPWWSGIRQSQLKQSWIRSSLIIPKMSQFQKKITHYTENQDVIWVKQKGQSIDANNEMTKPLELSDKNIKATIIEGFKQ